MTVYVNDFFALTCLAEATEDCQPQAVIREITMEEFVSALHSASEHKLVNQIQRSDSLLVIQKYAMRCGSQEAFVQSKLIDVIARPYDVCKKGPVRDYVKGDKVYVIQCMIDGHRFFFIDLQ